MKQAVAIPTLLLLLLGACTTAPLTQRRQIILTSEEQELALGEMQYRELLRNCVLTPDRKANRIVQKVGNRLAQVVNRADYAWEFVVINEPTVVHTQVFPSGKVVVYTGIFPVARDETGLAILLSHDIAHALARHQGEKASRDVLMELGSMGVTFGPDLVRQAYGAGTSLGLIMPFGQVQESEADALGLLLVAKAGYDPHAALEVWERLVRASEQLPQPALFLLTHPGYDMRHQTIKRTLPTALQHYSQTGSGAIPEPLPSLASLEPADETEAAVTQAMGTLDRLAVLSTDGRESITETLAKEFGLTPQVVENAARSFTLRPGELAFVFTLAAASGEPLERLAVAVEQTGSWPEIARNHGVSLTDLIPRLRAVEASAQRREAEPKVHSVW